MQRLRDIHYNIIPDFDLMLPGRHWPRPPMDAGDRVMMSPLTAGPKLGRATTSLSRLTARRGMGLSSHGRLWVILGSGRTCSEPCNLHGLVTKVEIFNHSSINVLNLVL